MDSRPPRHRKRIRRPGWDYSEPADYYVTICTKRRGSYLAEVTDGQLVLTPLGSVADFFWRQIPAHFPHVVLDEYVVMPDHVHGILRFTPRPGGRVGPVVCHGSIPRRGVQLNAPTGDGRTGDGRTGRADGGVTNGCAQDGPEIGGHHARISPRAGSLAVVMRTWKGAVKQWANENDETGFAWQRLYYDHIIRDPVALWRIRRYIRENPAAFLRGMHPDSAEEEAQQQ
jgi:putative transposase